VVTAGARGGLIEVTNLTKTFGVVQAVRNLSFTVSPGRITGFLGPNGAGKTTTLRMLLGLVNPTAGTATLYGRRYADLPNPNKMVGAVLEATSFHPSRRARSHLRMIAIAGGIETSRCDEMLALVGLADAGRRRVGGFSLGMRQRLQLASALLGDPGILILDEPANGLDPQGIAWLRDFLRHLAGEGRTVLVSSHLLAEMSQTVDDVVILSQGQLRAQGPLASLAAQARPAMRVRTPEPDRLMTLLQRAGLPFGREAFDVVRVDGTTPEQLGPMLAQHQIVLYELVREAANLESLFLSLTSGVDEPQLPTSPRMPATTGGWTPPIASPASTQAPAPPGPAPTPGPAPGPAAPPAAAPSAATPPPATGGPA
jgi:ABC-2 type transport system ATP-binding protein